MWLLLCCDTVDRFIPRTLNSPALALNMTFKSTVQYWQKCKQHDETFSVVVILFRRPTVQASNTASAFSLADTSRYLKVKIEPSNLEFEFSYAIPNNHSRFVSVTRKHAGTDKWYAQWISCFTTRLGLHYHWSNKFMWSKREYQNSFWEDVCGNEDSTRLRTEDTI